MQREGVRLRFAEKLADRDTQGAGNGDDFDIGQDALLVLDPRDGAAVDDKAQGREPPREILLGDFGTGGPAEFPDTGSEEIAAGCR